MVFTPKHGPKTVLDYFPNFVLNDQCLEFVNEFKYLGHIISIMQLDDTNILRERKKLFHRYKVLIRRFSNCLLYAKQQLNKTLHLFV